MSFGTSQVIRVKSDNPEHGGFMEINASDFDAAVHEVFEGAAEVVDGVEKVATLAVGVVEAAMNGPQAGQVPAQPSPPPESNAGGAGVHEGETVDHNTASEAGGWGHGADPVPPPVEPQEADAATPVAGTAETASAEPAKAAAKAK